MKRSAILGVVLWLCAVAGLWASGSRDWSEDERVFRLSGFDSIDVGGGIELSLKQDKSFSVRISGPDSSLDNLDVEVHGDRLTIGFRAFSFGINRGRVRAEVSMPTLTGLELSGGSRASILFDSRDKRVFVEASGGSRIEGTLLASELILDLNGGSAVSLEGYAQTVTIEASGGSRVDSGDFAAGSASVECSGGSYAFLAVQDSLSVDASGGSRIEYRGNPEIQSETSGGSAVRKR